MVRTESAGAGEAGSATREANGYSGANGKGCSDLPKDFVFALSKMGGRFMEAFEVVDFSVLWRREYREARTEIGRPVRSSCNNLDERDCGVALERIGVV